MKEIIKVYTKYDVPALTVIVPYIRKLTKRELGEFTNLSDMTQTGFMAEKEYQHERTEHGLEGVRYFHYETYP